MRLHATRSSPSSDPQPTAEARSTAANQQAPREPESPDAADTVVWSMWKRLFEAWEPTAARMAEQALRKPWVLEPAGFMLTSLMRAKIVSDRMTDGWLTALGFSTRREQLRLRHEINTLSSRLLDLQERLEASESGGAR